MALAEIFNALGDPVRLELVERLVHGELTITSVSANIGISRQGVRKHLQVLADAHVVRLEPKGRDVIVKLDKEAFDRALSYISELEMRWDRRLDALKRFVEEDPGC
jgi:DNA-binding transcriptional ArsR family regulator